MKLRPIWNDQDSAFKCGPTSIARNVNLELQAWPGPGFRGLVLGFLLDRDLWGGAGALQDRMEPGTHDLEGAAVDLLVAHGRKSP